MNWEAAGALGEIIGAIAVFATLFYLALQVRLSNNLANASTEIDIRNNFSSLNEMMISNPELADLFVKSKEKNALFSEAEEIQLQAWVRRFLNAQLAIETAHENGMVPNETYNQMFDDTRGLITRYPGIVPIWKVVLSNWSALKGRRVIIYVNEIIEEFEESAQ